MMNVLFYNDHQIDLRNRKLIVPLLLFASTIDIKSSTDREAHRFIAKLRRRVRDEATHFVFLESEKPLDRHLRLVLSESVIIYMKHQPGALGRTGKASSRNWSYLRSTSGQFARGVISIRCHRCAAGTGHVCDGKDLDKDKMTLNQAGECWNPLRLLLDFCSQTFLKVYGPHLNRVQGDLDVTYRTVVAKKRPREVSATTRFKDDPRRRRLSIVRISVPVELFKAGHYYAMVYLLFHELIVHAPQQVNSSSKRVPLGECPFSEGLIDALAYELMSIEIRGAPAFISNRRHSFLKAARRLKAQGYTPVAEEVPALDGQQEDVEDSEQEDVEDSEQEDLDGGVAERRSLAQARRDRGEELYDRLREEWTVQQMMSFLLPLNMDALKKQDRKEFVEELLEIAEAAPGGLPPEIRQALLGYKDRRDANELMDVIVPGRPPVESLDLDRVGFPKIW